MKKDFIALVHKKLSKKLFTGEEFTVQEDALFEELHSSFLKEHKKELELSWNIEVQSYLNLEKKSYFKAMACMRKEGFEWIPTKLAEMHKKAFFNDGELTEVTLYESNRVRIDADLESMHVTLVYLKKGKVVGNKHIRKYELSELPLFKNRMDMYKRKKNK